MEREDDDVILADKESSNKKQMWTRNTVDELENWFIWSNAEGTDDKFLAAPNENDLKMEGMILSYVIINPFYFLTPEIVFEVEFYL